MNIIGPDALVFGVDDLPACRQYLVDYGLKDAGEDRFEALDGTAIALRAKDDPTLPPAMGTASLLRETVYGVGDAAALDAIETELRRDREVSRRDGVVRSVDDMGFALAFQVSVRRPITLSAERVNAPGDAAQRGPNQLGLPADMPALPRSLSHVVYFVPDADKAEAFYRRLGFVCTDRFTGVGPFLRPRSCWPGPVAWRRAIRVSGARAAIVSAATGSGISTRPWAATSNTTPTWTCTTTAGARVKRPWAPMPRSCSCSSIGRSGRRAARLPLVPGTRRHGRVPVP